MSNASRPTQAPQDPLPDADPDPPSAPFLPGERPPRVSELAGSPPRYPAGYPIGYQSVVQR